MLAVHHSHIFTKLHSHRGDGDAERAQELWTDTRGTRQKRMQIPDCHTEKTLIYWRPGERGDGISGTTPGLFPKEKFTHEYWKLEVDCFVVTDQPKKHTQPTSTQCLGYQYDAFLLPRSFLHVHRVRPRRRSFSHNAPPLSDQNSPITESRGEGRMTFESPLR